MRKLLPALACFCIIGSVRANPVFSCRPLHITAADSTPVKNNYHYQVITLAGGAFGYDVFQGSKKLIHQDCIPGVPGNKAFATREQAGKVATLVISKLQQNIFPPTVSTEELKQLRVL